MKVRGIVDGEIVRPLTPLGLEAGTEVEIIVPERATDDDERARARERGLAALHELQRQAEAAGLSNLKDEEIEEEIRKARAERRARAR